MRSLGAVLRRRSAPNRSEKPTHHENNCTQIIYIRGKLITEGTILTSVRALGGASRALTPVLVYIVLGLLKKVCSGLARKAIHAKVGASREGRQEEGEREAGRVGGEGDS